MQPSLISIKEISKVYNSSQVKVHALRDFSLDIEQGEFVSIIGPSGSGKTTLMDILGCLSKPSSGQYKFEGRDVGGLDEDTLAEFRGKKIGFVFQSFNLLPRLSALQNVELPLIYGGVSAKERARMAIEALESVGLGDRARHRPSALSGGQTQRVAIARALVTNPSLILADEPTGNLDSKSEEEILRLFEKLHEKGNTLVLVTHNQAVADRVLRTISVRDGSVVSDTIRA
jgi:putative ABC transport system ATP-binding protein